MTALLDLPSPRAEAWRWADFDGLRAAAELAPGAPVDPATLFLDIDGPRLLFVNGAFEPAHSFPGPVRVEEMALETEHPLGAMARGEGWRLTLAAGSDAGVVQVVHIAMGGDNHVPAHITLGEDATATLVETYAGAGWSNRLCRIALGRGARLMRAVRMVQRDGFVSIREEAEVSAAASLVSIFLGAGAMGCRIDGAVRVTGAGGYAEIGGALLTQGQRKQEAAVVVRHDAVEGSSRQFWRAVAADRSAASIAARVEVARGAQQTDARQSLRGLLLQRTATVNLKPELEIFADDVQCAHGATVGELDRQALFYLESRGVEKTRARALLTRAFVADVLERIGEDRVREAFLVDAQDRLDTDAPGEEA